MLFSSKKNYENMENAEIYNTIKEGQVKGPNTLHLALKMLHDCQLLPWECNLVISGIVTLLPWKLAPIVHQLYLAPRVYKVGSYKGVEHAC